MCLQHGGAPDHCRDGQQLGQGFSRLLGRPTCSHRGPGTSEGRKLGPSQRSVPVAAAAGRRAVGAARAAVAAGALGAGAGATWSEVSPKCSARWCSLGWPVRGLPFPGERLPCDTAATTYVRGLSPSGLLSPPAGLLTLGAWALSVPSLALLPPSARLCYLPLSPFPDQFVSFLFPFLVWGCFLTLPSTCCITIWGSWSIRDVTM